MIVSSPNTVAAESATATGADQELDLVWGAAAIGGAINRNARQAFHMLEAGELPAKKVMGRWVASRRALRRHFGIEVADAR